MTRAPVFVLVALLAISGCTTKPEDVPLAGTWTGSVIWGGLAVSFTYELRESEGVIAGSGSVAYDRFSFTGDVAGSYVHPDVRMTLAVYFEGDTYNYRWVGTRTSDDVLSGVIHAGGSPDSMTILRGADQKRISSRLFSAHHPLATQVQHHKHATPMS